MSINLQRLLLLLLLCQNMLNENMYLVPTNVPFAVAALRPTTAPSARAAREKQTVSGAVEHEAPFTHAVSHFPLCVLSEDPEQHMSV